MSTVPIGRTKNGRGAAPVAAGRRFTVSSPVDCAVSIGRQADAEVGDFRCAQLQAGVSYTFFLPAAAGAQQLSGETTDANGDAVPTTLTYTDTGASGI